MGDGSQEVIAWRCNRYRRLHLHRRLLGLEKHVDGAELSQSIMCYSCLTKVPHLTIRVLLFTYLLSSTSVSLSSQHK